MYAIVFHAHQKLDRAAYRRFKSMAPPQSFFPTIRQVLKFEAGHGPDSAKLKRHSKSQQPWHFINPFDEDDTSLYQQIEQHYIRLVKELKNKDSVRAAFEAAWLAHALVDGLTPAHHYPYEAELEELRSGQSRDSRKGLAGRLYVKSDTVVETIHRSLKLIGPKGLLTSHALFEAGAYAIIAPLRFNKALPSKQDIKLLKKEGLVTVFRQNAQEIVKMDIYGRFCDSGWIQPVIQDIRSELAPRMVKIIALAWYAALEESI